MDVRTLIYATTTLRGVERRAGYHYLIPEAELPELAAAGALEPPPPSEPPGAAIVSDDQEPTEPSAAPANDSGLSHALSQEVEE